MKKPLIVCFAAVIFTTNPSWSDEAAYFSKTTHEATIHDQKIFYTAMIGSIPVRTSEGKETGKIFYTAYRKENCNNKDRPITFAFNGGPGSSSVWLHMGALGPKRVLNAQEGQSPRPPYQWTDNSESLLDLTDLVFIDPIGTGFSRQDPENKDVSFYDVESDIQSIGDFIRDYVTMEGRWASPKYLIGESYGTLRACGLSDYLQSKHGLYLNGLVLISCAIDFQTLCGHLDNEAPFTLFIPSFAAAAWYHGRLDPALNLQETVEKAKKFAINTLTPSLFIEGKISSQFFPEIAHWTGLSLDMIEQNDGFIDDDTFFVSLLSKEKKVIGRFDSCVTGEILPPRTIRNYRDPSESAIDGIYTATWQAYMRDELACTNYWPRYEIISDLKWNFQGFGYPNTMNCLRNSFVINPSMRVFVACGYFDLATPFSATEYCFRRLHLPCENNLTFGYYEGGHMFYTHLNALKEFKKDMTNFYSNSK